jgi:hypothetical protein
METNTYLIVFSKPVLDSEWNPDFTLPRQITSKYLAIPNWLDALQFIEEIDSQLYKDNREFTTLNIVNISSVLM